MQNNQSSSNDRSSGDKSLKNTMQTKGEQFKSGADMQEGAQAQEGSNQLDQFVTFIKANWRTVLAELVAAGVSAYLAHGAKDKAAKPATIKN